MCQESGSIAPVAHEPSNPNRKHREADLGDVVASKRMLIDTGYVDETRIGIIGESYGG